MTSTQNAELNELNAQADQLLALARQEKGTISGSSGSAEGREVEQQAELAPRAPLPAKKPSRPPEPPSFLEKPVGRALAFLFTLVCAVLLVALFRDWIRLPGEPVPGNVPQRVPGLLGGHPRPLQPLAVFRTKHNVVGGSCFVRDRKTTSTDGGPRGKAVAPVITLTARRAS